jgi:hypothetical protein
MSGTNRAAIVSALFLITSAAQAAVVVDLTTAGSSGAINGAIFRQFTPPPASTAVLNSFLRIQSDFAEQGYNTDFGNVFNQTSNTRSLLLGEIPKVTLSDVLYREFLLDINEGNATPLLSLNDVELFMGSQPALATYANLGTPIYKMDGGANNSVKLDYSLNGVSGLGDMVMYVPDALFDPAKGPYVYLYSRLGQAIPGDQSDVSSDGGYEEWSAGQRGPRGTIIPVTVPEPMSMSLLILSVAGVIRRRGR